MNKAKILVVEDEAIIAKDLQARLQQMGYDVPFIAATGEDAIDKALKISPDLVLMDIMLPGSMDGIEAARQIRSRRTTPIIYLSAYTNMMQYEGAKDTEPYGYMCKPVTDYDLRNNIEMALHNYATERKLREEKKFAEMAIDAQIDTFFVFDPATGKAVRWNKRFREISGYTDEEIAAMKAPDSYYSPEDLEKAADVINNILNKGQGTVEISLICKDGRKIPTEYIASVITDEETKVTYIISIGRDITGRKQDEGKIRATLKEKEVLMREIHHRVKNNMAIISSLLRLQSSKVVNEHYRAMFNESINRIKAMTLIHEKLYQSEDLSKIIFSAYVNDMVKNIFHSFGLSPRIKLITDIEEMTLGIDASVPCGLIVNELITNSIKYAFPEGRDGVITVSLHAGEKGEIELAVSDNGVGIPAELDFRNTDSLGLTLVNDLVRQLQGRIELHRGQGTRFQITFRI